MSSFLCVVRENNPVKQYLSEGQSLTLTYVSLVSGEGDIKLTISSHENTQFEDETILCTLSAKRNIFQSVLHVVCSDDLKSIILNIDRGKSSLKRNNYDVVSMNVFGQWNQKVVVNSQPTTAPCTNENKRDLQIMDESPSSEAPSKKRNRKRHESNQNCKVDQSLSPIGEKDVASEREQKIEKKSMPSTASNANIVGQSNHVKKHTLLKWEPQFHNGFIVPRPKSRNGIGGIGITDYVIGKGVVPSAGSMISILYECLLPDGTIIDSHLDSNHPVTFYKGTSQIMEGIDYGIENMRIGGARELLVPFQLTSQGKKSSIPVHPHYIFRIRLIA